ncbi:MAG: long-chain fatty acid--CoA ligase [Flavobacteriales bacterium]|jgi:long-chain acyl-CoA synthetase|nr:long-chain fatty acid--CoA ligase [Flavobacteriales bacterium]
MEKYNEIKRIFDVPQFQLKHYPQAEALVSKVKGKWVKTSIQEYIEQANLISKGLIKLGIQPGDKIAVISNNRTEWNILDIGISQAGAISVPVYPTITVEDYEYIFNNAEVKLCFVSDKELHHKAVQTFDKVSTLQEIYSFEEVEGSKNWSEVLKLGEDGDQAEVEKRKEAIQATDLATMIYTSGTTGRPKGVMLSHQNLVENAKGSRPRLPVSEGKVALSFLPLCHVYERMLIYLYQMTGISIYYAESLETIVDDITDARPHVFTAVPRLLEKIYDGVMAKGVLGGGIKAKIFTWAMGLTKTYVYGKHPSLQRRIADKLVYSKVREKLGGRVLAVASGSAALQPRLAQFYLAIGIPVFEGYGLTETSPVVSVNSSKTGVKFGTVGKVLDNVEVKIAEDGEILTKGPCLMMGYYKQEEKTKEVIDADGWFHTGDIGEIDAEGFLKITDRKKEMFKTSGGKYVAPQVVENKMKESQFIEQIMVVGEGKKHPAAIIVPAFEFLCNWATDNDIDYNSNEDLIKNKAVLAKFSSEINHYNTSFGKWEQIKKFELLANEWTVETEELTPTLKLKRKIIHANNAALIEGIYN